MAKVKPRQACSDLSDEELEESFARGLSGYAQRMEYFKLFPEGIDIRDAAKHPERYEMTAGELHEYCLMLIEHIEKGYELGELEGELCRRTMERAHDFTLTMSIDAAQDEAKRLDKARRCAKDTHEGLLYCYRLLGAERALIELHERRFASMLEERSLDAIAPALQTESPTA